jgi:hypothetical protein
VRPSRCIGKGDERGFSLYKEGGAATVKSLSLKGRSESEARSGERIRASAPLEPQERSHAMEARGRERVLHPKVIKVTIQAKKAKLKAFAIREPELRGERSPLREEDRHGEGEACHHSLESVPAPSLPVCCKARRYVHARGAGSLEPRERSL